MIFSCFLQAVSFDSNGPEGRKGAKKLRNWKPHERQPAVQQKQHTPA